MEEQGTMQQQLIGEAPEPVVTKRARDEAKIAKIRAQQARLTEKEERLTNPLASQVRRASIAICEMIDRFPVNDERRAKLQSIILSIKDTVHGFRGL